MPNHISLTFYFNGFKFEFALDIVYITNLITRRKYCMSFDHFQSEVPFRFELVERNIKDDRTD